MHTCIVQLIDKQNFLFIYLTEKQVFKFFIMKANSQRSKTKHVRAEHSHNLPKRVVWLLNYRLPKNERLCLCGIAWWLDRLLAISYIIAITRLTIPPKYIATPDLSKNYAVKHITYG